MALQSSARRHREGHPLRRLLFISIALTSWITLAQSSQTGFIMGRVTDNQGDPVPGVVATVSGETVQGRNTVSGSDGEYKLGFLKPGIYEMRFTMPGFHTVVIPDVVVNATKTTVQNVVLTPATVAETLEVTATTPLIDTDTTEVSSILTSEDVQKLPVTRTATDLIEFTPGARPGQLWGGSTGQANNYQVDGVSVNSPGFGGAFLLPNVSWIKEFQVKGLGAGAEYGNFQGGLVNIVTKSGSNDFAGNVQFLLENDALNSQNLVAGEEGAEVDSFQELNADVSGALVKDRLFYFFSAEQQTRDVRVVDVANSTTTDVAFLNTLEERTETKLYGKLTFTPTQTDTINLVLGWDDVATDNNGLDSFTRPDATTTQDSPASFYNVNWEKIFGDASFLEVKYSGWRGENNNEPVRGRTIPGVQILGGNRDLGRNAPYTRLQDLSTDALAINLTTFFDTAGMEHQLKVGGEYTIGESLEQRIRNGNLTWRPEEGDAPFDFDDPSTWGFISSDWGGGIRLDTESVNAAVYVQDYVSVNDHLDFNVGLRAGNWRGDVTPGFSTGPQFEAVSDTGIAPRLGVTFDFTGEETWIGKVHYGRYYQNIFSLFYDRVTGADAFQDLAFWDWDAAGLPDLDRTYTEAERDELFVFFDSQAIGSEDGPIVNYNQPYVDQTVVSLEHKFTKRWAGGITYVNRENNDIVSLVDTNRASNYTTFNNVSVIDFRTGNPILDAGGNPLVLDQVLVSNRDIIDRGWAPGLSDEDVANLSFDQNLVLTNVDEAERSMDQIQIKLEGFTDAYSLTASVVWTDLIGNFYSVSGYDDPGGSGAGAFVDVNESTNFHGNMPNYSEWEVKLRFSTELPWGFNLGAFYRWDSGDFYTPSYTIDRRNHDFIAADGELFSPRHFVDVSGESIYLEDRGSREYEAFSRLDLHLDKEFRFNRSRLQIGFDIFNLFNDDAAIRVNDDVNEQDINNPTTLFGAVRVRQAPRTVRLFSALRW